MKLGELIRQRRRDLNMTQEELAKVVEVKHSYISKIETGENRGSYEVLAKIAMALRLDWKEMMNTGDVRVPGWYDFVAGRSDSLSPILDKHFEAFHPIIKEQLIQIGDMLSQYPLPTPLPEVDLKKQKAEFDKLFENKPENS